MKNNLLNSTCIQLSPNSSELELFAQDCVKYIWDNEYYSRKFSGELLSFNTTPDIKFCVSNLIYIMKNCEYLSNNIKKRGALYDEFFWEYVTQYIKNSEKNLYFIRKMSTPEDPIILLGNLIIGKSWEEAKFIMTRLMPASFLYSNYDLPSDEKAEYDFQRYNNVKSYGTYLDLEFIRKTSIFYDSNNIQIIKRLNQVCEEAEIFIKDNVNLDSEQVKIYLSLFKDKNTNCNTTIKVYRGTSNPHAKIRIGDFVTPSIDYARDYIRGPVGTVIDAQLFLKDCIVSKRPFEHNAIELVFFPENSETKTISKQYYQTRKVSFKELYDTINSSI